MAHESHAALAPVRTRAAFLAFLFIVPATVLLYAWMTFGVRLVGRSSLANAPERITWWDIVATALVTSVIPALVYSATSAIVHHRQRGRSWEWGVLALLYPFCWLGAAFLVADSFALELGTTWLPSEVLIELVLAQPWTWIAFIAGTLLSVSIHWVLIRRHR